MNTSRVPARLIALAALVSVAPVGALTVTRPVPGDTIAAGTDFATTVVGDAWDMSNVQDIALAESGNLAAQSIAGGRYSGISTSNDPGMYALHPGLNGTINLSRGQRSPIDTATFRQFTIKIRHTDGSGGTLVAQQPLQVFFFPTGDNSQFGQSSFHNLAPNQWNILSFDMLPDSMVFSSPVPSWTTSAQVRGFRVDPTAVGTNVRAEIDWIRLTAAPTAAQKFLVQWTDSATTGPYTITAIDTDGATFVVANGIANATSFLADFSMLAPGDYTVQVDRTGASSQSTVGALHISYPPQITLLTPSARGDQSSNFALIDRHNPWGPIEATDVLSTANVTNVSYTNPAGSLSARPTTGDSRVSWVVQPPGIDAARYRSLCITMQVFGPRNIGAGSVARVFWGPTAASLAISDDIIVEEGTNEYCLEDMSTIQKDPTSPAINWTGTVGAFRLDPHEFAPSPSCSGTPTPENCRDFRIDSVILSPFSRADRTFTFQWILADPDAAIGLDISFELDPDRNPSNGNSIAIANTVAGTTPGYLTWTAPGSVPDGVYYVRVTANDGLNSVSQYSSGPLIVAQPGDVIFRNGFNY